MSYADAAWLHMDRPTNLMVVNGLLLFDEPLDRDRMREVVRERLVERYPRFKRRVVEAPLGLGLPHWEDDPEFDLDLHLHHIALPAPGDTSALQDLVGDLMIVPLDRSRPLWDMYVVDGFGTGTAVVSRMHHCIADGIALARVLLSLTDDEPDAGVAPPEPEEGGHGILDTFTAPARMGLHVAEAALVGGREAASNPATAATALVQSAIADTRALGKLLLTGADHDSALRGKPGVARRVAWTDRIALDEVKAIGHATGTTVNDVVLTAVTGALHRYLADRGEVPDQIRAMVPFNLRPLDQPLPRELGNRFGLVYLELPVGIEDRAARLAEVHRRMNEIKHTPEGAVSYGILGIIGATPLPAEQRLIDVFSTKATAVMTNVPGPRRPVYFAGSRVTGVLGWVPAAGDIGFGVSIFSYDGGVTVGLQTAAALVPDPATIVDTLGGELLGLAELRPRRRARPRRRSAPARTRAPRKREVK
jgi:WS/DGAT/MGAT family acyltransferase